VNIEFALNGLFCLLETRKNVETYSKSRSI